MDVRQSEDGSLLGVLTNANLREIIRRWVRGFHAALYGEYLPANATFATYPPLPEGKKVESQVTFVAIPDAFPEFVKELKRNRAASNLDRIVCRNGKCRYECVWSQANDGRWICIYCLDLYNWIDLGDPRNASARGCVGCYRRMAGGVPNAASTGTRLVFKFKNASPFDPFAE
ncbi:MAG: hypothetical protein ABSA52_10475 [Candidatus Binatia bacterium]|jgi:hypothetical protein